VKADEFSVLRLWRKGFDTKAIAAALDVREHEVANALARIFDKVRS
jgi:DNA-binding CsgD family transcriptional regulator